MDGLAFSIEQASDDEAIAALQLVLERQGQPVDAFALKRQAEHVGEALRQPEVADVTAPAPATGGDLARFALLHIAADDGGAALVRRALAVAPRSTRVVDPGSLAVGAMVLLAFRTEVKLEKNPERGWSFRFHVKPLRDSTVGRLLSQLIGAYADPQP